MAPLRFAWPLCFATLACAGSAEVVGTANDLQPSFVITPSTVRTGDSCDAVVSIANPTQDTIVVSNPCGCLITLTVFHAGAPVSLRGTLFVCQGLTCPHAIPPRDSLTRTFRLIAVLDRRTAPLPLPGSYLARANLPDPLLPLYAELTIVP
ncbi:MAG: hypothetical protein GTN62_05335 [Gemmatimonadales bacterium]|nr:hypothetical protein [Gemmatimonadales bacterium]NIN49520.1 hypothetical protein [Gemmatimonadales bacterium]NIP06984.1 hypothetical protein [Gemmatimonadales bacterium]NIS63852.1 hypothetical protein [Gemmatimonadales bacterium]